MIDPRHRGKGAYRALCILPPELAAAVEQTVEQHACSDRAEPAGQASVGGV